MNGWQANDSGRIQERRNMTLQEAFQHIFADKPVKITISKKLDSNTEYDKIVFSLKNGKEKNYYQIEKFTKTQVFHENITPDFLQRRVEKLFTGNYKQLNSLTDSRIIRNTLFWHRKREMSVLRRKSPIQR